ncbi:uncharacterized protein TNCV_4835551 [Trichonephila clavipes]|nr:uncharacterized protein TNCV_4835551 [Trichonephila clavipes]
MVNTSVGKLELFLQNKNANVMIVAVFLITHASLAGMSVNILNEKEVIALLYTLNIIMTIHSIDASYTNALQRSRMVRKPAVVRSIRSVAMDYGYKETKYSNLYIEHWKKTNMYLSPQFPLERLAYLNSVLHFCDRKHIFFLRNSQMKELTSKKVNPKHCDEECHPSKLVTDLFATYIHRRALFFRSRNVPSAGKKQFTKSYFYQKRNENLENFEHTLLYRKEREEQLKGESISSYRDLGKKRKKLNLSLDLKWHQIKRIVIPMRSIPDVISNV